MPDSTQDTWQPIDWSSLDPELQAIGQVESSRDTDPKYLAVGRRAIKPDGSINLEGGAGPFQMTAGLAREIATSHPELEQKYGRFSTWGAEDIKHVLSHNSAAAVDYAKAKHEDLKGEFPDSPLHRMAAWNWGSGAVKNMSQEQILAGNPAGDSESYGKDVWKHYQGFLTGQTGEPALQPWPKPTGDIAAMYPGVADVIKDMRKAGFDDTTIEESMFKGARKAGLSPVEMNKVFGGGTFDTGTAARETAAEATHVNTMPYLPDYLEREAGLLTHVIQTPQGAISDVAQAVGFPGADEQAQLYDSMMGNWWRHPLQMGLQATQIPQAFGNIAGTAARAAGGNPGQQVFAAQAGSGGMWQGSPEAQAAFHQQYGSGEKGIGGGGDTGDFLASQIAALGPGILSGVMEGGVGAFNHATDPFGNTSPMAGMSTYGLVSPETPWHHTVFQPEVHPMAGEPQTFTIRRGMLSDAEHSQAAHDAMKYYGIQPTPELHDFLVQASRDFDARNPLYDETQYMGNDEANIARLDKGKQTTEPQSNVLTNMVYSAKKAEANARFAAGSTAMEDRPTSGSPIGPLDILKREEGSSGLINDLADGINKLQKMGLGPDTSLGTKLGNRYRQLLAQRENVPTFVKAAMKSDPVLDATQLGLQEKLLDKGVITPEEATLDYQRRVYLDKMNPKVAEVWRKNRPIKNVDDAVAGMMRDHEVYQTDGSTRPVANEAEARAILDQFENGNGQLRLRGRSPFQSTDLSGLRSRSDVPQWLRNYWGEVTDGVAGKVATVMELKKLDAESSFFRDLSNFNDQYAAGREHELAPLEGALSTAQKNVLGDLATKPLLPEIRDHLATHVLIDKTSRGLVEKLAQDFSSYEKATNVLLNSHIYAKKYALDVLGGASLGPSAWKNIPSLIRELVANRGYSGPLWQKVIEGGGIDGTSVSGPDLNWIQDQYKQLAKGGEFDPTGSGWSSMMKTHPVRGTLQGLGEVLSAPINLFRASHFLEATTKGIRTHDPMGALAAGDLSLWSKKQVLAPADAAAYSARYFMDQRHAQEMLPRALGSSIAKAASEFYYTSYPIELPKILWTVAKERPMAAIATGAAGVLAHRLLYALAETTPEQIGQERPISDQGQKQLEPIAGLKNSRGDQLLADVHNLIPGFNLFGGLFHHDPRLGFLENSVHNLVTGLADYMDADIVPESDIRGGEAWGLTDAQITERTAGTLLGGALYRQGRKFFQGNPQTPLKEENDWAHTLGAAVDMPLSSAGSTGRAQRGTEILHQADDLLKELDNLPNRVARGELGADREQARRAAFERGQVIHQHLDKLREEFQNAQQER